MDGGLGDHEGGSNRISSGITSLPGTGEKGRRKVTETTVWPSTPVTASIREDGTSLGRGAVARGKGAAVRDQGLATSDVSGSPDAAAMPRRR
jgi:hypothetical protein